MEGNFEKFSKLISQMSPSEIAEIKLRPRLGNISEVKEDPAIYLSLLAKGCSPKTALQASKEHETLDAALSALGINK